VIGRAILAGAAVLLVGGCATRPTAPRLPYEPPSATVPQPAPSATLSPRLYVALTSNVSLIAVRASNLASSRASDPRLRELARQIASDQAGVASQLSYAGRRVNLLPDAALPPRAAEELKLLETSASFDADYSALMKRALQRGWQAHAHFARVGASPTLRSVARFAEPITRRNLDAVSG
jgi:putative membrane protein